MPTAYDKRAEGESESKTPQEQAAMVRASRQLIKRLDPTRPVMDTAGGEFFESEVNSLMRYGFSGPQNFRRARAHYPALRADRVNRIPGRPPTESDPKPLIVGELGGYIYFADIDKFKRQWGGATPWPIVRSAGLGWGILGEQMAVDYEQRFYQWGLDAVYGDFTRFAARHAWFAFGDLKDEVEQIRKSPDITGNLFTMFSNIGPYVHGLFDYDMNLRPFHRKLAALNSPDLLIIDWEQLNCWSGETFSAEVLLSHYSGEEIKDCSVRWRLEGYGLDGEIGGVNMDGVGVAVVGGISFAVPVVERGTRARLEIELRRGGARLSGNYVDLYFYPADRRRVAGGTADQWRRRDGGAFARAGIRGARGDRPRPAGGCDHGI